MGRGMGRGMGMGMGACDDCICDIMWMRMGMGMES